MVRTAATAIKTTGGKSSKAAAAAGGSTSSSASSGTSKKLTGGGGHNRFVKVAVPNWQKPITIFLKPGCKYNNWRKETIVETNLTEDEIVIKSPIYEGEDFYGTDDGAAGSSSKVDETAETSDIATENVDSTDDEAVVIATADTDSDDDTVTVTVNNKAETSVDDKKKTIYETVEIGDEDDDDDNEILVEKSAIIDLETPDVDPEEMAKMVREECETGGFDFSELSELEDISFKEQAKERALMEANAKGLTKRAKSKASILMKSKGNKENGDADEEEPDKKRSLEDSDDDNVDAKKAKV